MAMFGIKYADAVKNAEHHLAIGEKEVYLSEGPYPWSLAESCEPGGTHRIDISTSVYFRAKHESGLAFRWTFDIESRDANGKGHYEINTIEIRKVMRKLPTICKKSFSAYLKDCAVAVESKGVEWQGYADRQFNDARILNQVAMESDNG